MGSQNDPNDLNSNYEQFSEISNINEEELQNKIIQLISYFNFRKKFKSALYSQNLYNIQKGQIYLIDKEWLNKWKESIGYSQIKNCYRANNYNRDLNEADFQWIQKIIKENSKNIVPPFNNKKIFDNNNNLNIFSEFVIVDKNCYDLFKNGNNNRALINDKAYEVILFSEKLILVIDEKHILLKFFRIENEIKYSHEIIIKFLSNVTNEIKNEFYEVLGKTNLIEWLNNLKFNLDLTNEIKMKNRRIEYNIINRQLKLKKNKKIKGMPPIINQQINQYQMPVNNPIYNLGNNNNNIVSNQINNNEFTKLVINNNLDNFNNRKQEDLYINSNMNNKNNIINQNELLPNDQNKNDNKIPNNQQNFIMNKDNKNYNYNNNIQNNFNVNNCQNYNNNPNNNNNQNNNIFNNNFNNNNFNINFNNNLINGERNNDFNNNNQINPNMNNNIGMNNAQFLNNNMNLNNDIQNDNNFNQNNINAISLPHKIGLQNIGRTCYMNAVLQCLTNIDKLSNCLLNLIQQNYINNQFQPLVFEYTKLLYEFQTTNLSYLSPHNLKFIVEQLNPLFQGSQASDSKDFIIFIIERLHQELKPPDLPQDFAQFNIEQQELEAQNENLTFQKFINEFSMNSSIISDIFYGILRSVMKCEGCQTIKYSFQTFNILNFVLKKAKDDKKKILGEFFPDNYVLNLIDAFDSENKEEKLVGENMIYCNKCKGLKNGVIKQDILKSPEIMIIILNRGKNNQDFKEKFTFDEELNFTNYSFSNINNPNKKYFLCGIITHLGESGSNGHFICYFRKSNKQKFMCYNDASASEATVKDAMKEVISSNVNRNKTPYILFYQKY